MGENGRETEGSERGRMRERFDDGKKRRKRGTDGGREKERKA